MKVCLVTTSFPRWPGDSRAPFILETARAIHAQGVEIRVVAMHSPGAKTKEVIESIEVIRPRYLWPERLEVLQKEGGGLPIMWRTSCLARLALLFFFVAHTIAIMRYAKNYDIIHANWTLSAAAAWASRFYHRRPFIVTVQGSDIFQATRLPLVSCLTRTVLSQSERVLALSRSLAEATIALGLDPGQVEIIPHGVNTDRFQPSPATREPLILYVGSLIERKGLNYLVQAMPQVLQRFHEIRLVIAGEGPQESDLSNLARTLGVVEKVLFVGAQSQDQISRWMQRARLFVLPSLEEGLGVVLLEALASGIPCVATCIGGIQDVISPDVGILVTPANPTALADAIITLLEDQSLYNTMSHNARQRAVEYYSWNSISSRLIRIYQDIISRQGPK